MEMVKKISGLPGVGEGRDKCIFGARFQTYKIYNIKRDVKVNLGFSSLILMVVPFWWRTLVSREVVGAGELPVPSPQFC